MPFLTIDMRHQELPNGPQQGGHAWSEDHSRQIGERDNTVFLKLVSPAYNLLWDFRPVSGKKQSVFLCPSSIIFALKCFEMWREVSVQNKTIFSLKCL